MNTFHEGPVKPLDGPKIQVCDKHRSTKSNTLLWQHCPSSLSSALFMYETQWFTQLQVASQPVVETRRLAALCPGSPLNSNLLRKGRIPFLNILDLRVGLSAEPREASARSCRFHADANWSVSFGRISTGCPNFLIPQLLVLTLAKTLVQQDSSA